MEHQMVQNSEALATNALRRDALALVEAGYAAINTGAALTRELRIDGDVLRFGDKAHRLAERRIFFVGIGKCAIAGARAIEKIFGDRLTGGIALDVATPEGAALSKIEMFIGTHPLPTEANERASARITEMLSGCDADDLVLMLISGGGSTLLCLPQAPMTCLDEGALFTALTARSATIQEINTVRKHTSLVRGGGLAKAAYPAEVISLIISDVPGNDIEFIASGPTIQDTSTAEGARAILARYGVTPDETTTFVETPKDPKYFERVTNVLFVTNDDALRAMEREAARLGYAARIISDHVAGEARDVGRAIVETLHAAPPKSVLLYAGESTVTLGAHPALGGRNQEVALAALDRLHDDELLLPFSSDGRDNTDHAGAIADATTRAHAQAHHLSIADHLADHGTYEFFSTTGDALLVGYTESNVSDLIIAIKN